MKPFCSSYIRQVDRALDLPQHRKKKLLRGLQVELRERFLEEPSEETLYADVGLPEDVAGLLLDAVSPTEHRHFNSVRLHCFRYTIIVLALLIMIAFGTIVYAYSTELTRVEIDIIDDTARTSYSAHVDTE